MNRSVIERIRAQVANHGAKLLVVSKNRSLEQIRFLYDMGFRSMGENRVQSLLEKKDELPDDIEWHIIGHLQRNKVKYIAEFVALIHSIDSLRLLEEVQRQAEQYDRVIPVLLQFKVAEEDSKFGLEPKEIDEIIEHIHLNSFPNIEIQGIMGMGTFTDDERITIKEFEKLAEIFNMLKGGYFLDHEGFTQLSMGMSGDYELALQHGSTIVRLGSILFED